MSWTRSLLWVSALGAAGCGGGKAGPDAAVATAEVAQQRLEGKLRVQDKWVDVAPLVLHDGKMDLFVRCRLLRDEATAAGHEPPPLCYDPAPRELDAIEVIRVERWPNLPVAMRYLQAEAEGSHFLVERSGSTYQMLDLVYAARRGGEIARNEIRVVATDPGHGAAIAQALRTLYPKARVDEVDRTSERPRQGSGKVPFAPGGPHGRGHDHGHGHDHGGHGHEGHNHEGHNHEGHGHEGHNHEGHGHEGHNHEGHNHGGHGHDGHNPTPPQPAPSEEAR